MGVCEVRNKTLFLLVGCYTLLYFLIWPLGTAEGVVVLRFQEDRVATTETVAWYEGELDPSRKLHSVTLCARFYLFIIHGWVTFFVLTNAEGAISILEGDVWVDRVRPVFAMNWNFQTLKNKLWLYRWYHLCFTYDHQRHLISTYVDGKLNNHQEYDVGRHMSGDMVKLGQGKGVKQRSFSGDLTQVNVWDTALDEETIRAMAQCQTDPQGNYVSWEVGWALTNVTSRDVPLAELCRRVVDPAYFWYPSLPYDTAQYLCRALGSSLPDTMGDVLAIHDVSEATFSKEDSCHSDIWLAMNDIDEEGVWKIDGVPLAEETIGWANQEPNGHRYENCAAAGRRGMADVDCEANLKCAVCPVREQTQFSFLGTCESEQRNVYMAAFQSSPNDTVFMGHGDYHIKRLEGTWTWVNAVSNLTIARLEESVPDFPMGRRWWRLREPVCGQKPGGRRLLLLSPCGEEQFTCDDATCVPLDNRCDLRYDCRDNTDELECEAVAFPRDYQSHLPPRAGGTRGGGRSLPIVLALRVESLTVKTMEMTMEVSYQLQLTWVDNRLQYQNLKVKSTLNILPADTVSKLWVPQVSFVNTIGNQHTLMDEDTTVLVDRVEDSIGRNSTAPAEVEVFSGEVNTLRTHRKYGTVFMCDLDLALYPFDAQECYMHFRIISASNSFLVFDNATSSVNNSASNLLLEYDVGALVLEQVGSRMYSEMKVRVPLTRRYGYAILNIYIPSLVLLVVSYVTLFIRPAVLEVRVMSALTVQLVIATLFSQVSGSLPKTSYFKMVDVWLLFCIGITFLIIVFHVLVDNMLFRAEGVALAQPMAQTKVWVRPVNEVKPKRAAGLRKWTRPEWLEERLVLTTKGIALAVFLIFNFCYWGYILVLSK